MAKPNLIAVTSDNIEIHRIKQVAGRLDFIPHFFSNVDILMESGSDLPDAHLVVLSAAHIHKPDEIVGSVQVIKQVLSQARILVIVDKRMDADHAKFIKKSGASLVIFSQSFAETSQFEFICSQWIRGAFVPVKGAEFRPGTKVDFPLFYLMPLNQKIVPVVAKGTLLEDKKVEKLKAAQEIYVSRDDVRTYGKYLIDHEDLSANGLASRCRAKYLQFCKGYSDLVFLIIDQSEMASFEEGRALYDTCKSLASDLLMTLSSVGDAWLVVNNSALSDSGKIERSTAVACYAGLLSLMADIGQPESVMIAALLADLGMLDMPTSIFEKQRQRIEFERWSDEEKEKYRSHPILSINRCLSRKIPLDENIKKIILNSHERKDKLGFPHQVAPEKIPFESMLIQFCELIDDATLIKMGEKKVSVEDARKALVKKEFSEARYFSLEFLNRIKAFI